MDPISPAARREPLHEQIVDAQMVLRRAAAAAALKNDPLAEQLQALAVCVGALSDLYQASEATQIYIANTLKTQTGTIDRVHASVMDIVNNLAPQLASAADRTMRQKINTLRIRSIVFLSLALALAILLPSLFTYAAGLNAGRFQGEVALLVLAYTVLLQPGIGAEGRAGGREAETRRRALWLKSTKGTAERIPRSAVAAQSGSGG
jgi:hypothetical protein